MTQIQHAMDYIFGFTVALDVSARDWQIGKNGGQVLLGKAMDGFCPLGPVVVTKEDINGISLCIEFAQSIPNSASSLKLRYLMPSSSFLK